MFVFTGLFHTVVTGSLPWNEDGIELDYSKNFHTCLLVPLRDFIQDGIHFTVIKTKHMYVLEDPNALQNMETKPSALAKSKRSCFFEQNPTIYYVSYKIIAEYFAEYFVGGTVASWLARSTPERALRVRALAGDIVLCSWERHFTLTVPLSTQVYKWVLANLMLGGNPVMD